MKTSYPEKNCERLFFHFGPQMNNEDNDDDGTGHHGGDNDDDCSGGGCFAGVGCGEGEDMSIEWFFLLYFGIS